jgi:hypothetical protein
MYGISANRELLICPESELNRCIRDVNAESGRASMQVTDFEDL